ncbi:Mitochondrial outer membrane protein iml2 [Sporothrix bragantina]|uniref:Inclusion body clearance protein IML2 n=1 Tax=Sporothrix bragantina TaxID=671064 RepID=A0ABP0B2E4_9PEZI
MSSLRTWFRGSAPSSSKASREPSPAVSASTSMTAISGETSASSPAAAAAARELADMEDAMASTALLLNDDMEGAEARLRAHKDNSAFHLMGLGVSTFMRSVLGFEKEFMNEANARLLECETRAWEEMKKAQSAATGTTSSGWLGRSSTSTPTPSAGTLTGSIYPPGSEYALVHAESQIMLAVVAELHESLTEAIRGFYKLRKAFASLNTIIEAEAAYLRGETAHHTHGHGHGHGKTPSRSSTGRRMSYSEDPMPGAFDDKEFADLEAEVAAEEAAAAKGEALASKANGSDSPNAASGTAAASPGIENKTPSPTTASAAPSLSEKTAALSLKGTGGTPRTSSQISRSQTPTTASASAVTSAARARKRHLDTLTNPIDIFVHSGANLCFGLLLVLISMVPPAFSRLLSIVGFKGDRERGVRMLWQSTKFSNVYGGLAGLMLLVYYNGLIANADILPAEADIAELTNNEGKDSSEMEVVGYPKDRCHALLAHMRTLFPDSLLWVLEEARLLTTERRIKEAMKVLQGGGSDGKPRVAKMRQITALTKFELSIDAMCTMDWRLMSESFLACVELNTWSHALYYYNVGCAELELYRDAFHMAKALKEAGDVERANAAADMAAKHKKAAEMYLRKAPTMAGRKKFMARQMPFDVFVIRKLARWEERAKKHNIDLVDAVGVSPALEMAYLWGSAKKLPQDLLELALSKYLVWERCTADATVVAAFQAAPDESGIGSLCKAALLRAMGRLEEAQAVLDKELLVHDRVAFKGPTKDDYVLAAGHYEAAVILWLQASDPKYFPQGIDAVALDAYRHTKTNESLAMLDKVAKWETFVLDARIGMKLQTGLDSVKWLKEKKKWQ